MRNLKELGYSDWFKSRADEDKLTAHDIARVVTSLQKGERKYLRNYQATSSTVSNLPATSRLQETGFMPIFMMMIPMPPSTASFQEKHF